MNILSAGKTSTSTFSRESSDIATSGGKILPRIFKNVGILLSGRAVNAPLSLVHKALAIHLLGTYDFGLLAMVYAYARTIGDIVEFQSWQTVLHYGISPFKNEQTSLFQKVLRFSFVLDISSGLVGMAIGIAGGFLFAKILGWPPQLSLIGPAFCIIIIFMTSATAIGVLRLFNRFDLLAAHGTTSTIVRLIGTIILLFIHGTLAEMLCVWIVAEITSFFILGLFALRELKKRGLTKGLFSSFTRESVFPSRADKALKGIWSFAFNTNLNTTLYLAFGQVGTLVVGSILGPTSAGIYQIASQVASGVAKPIALIENTLYPEMARLWYEQNTRKLYRLALQTAFIASGSALGLIAIIGGLIFGLESFLLWLGQHHDISFAVTIAEKISHLIHKIKDANALSLTLWLLGAEVITIWGLPLEPLLITTRQTRAAIFARGITVLFFLPALVVTIRHFNLYGIGPVSVLATLLLLLLQIFFVIRSRLKYKKQT